MDWLHPQILLLALPALLLLYWADARSSHPIAGARRRLLLVVRSLMVVLVLAAMASPARVLTGREQSVIFVLDHSRSVGEEGLDRVYEAAAAVRETLGPRVPAGYVAAGAEPRLLAYPGQSAPDPGDGQALAVMEEIGAGSNFELAARLAAGLFPSGTSRHLVFVGDGVETAGSFRDAAREAAVSGIRIHTLGVAGEIQPDVRITRLTPSQSLLSEGAALELEAVVEGSLSGPGRLRLFENGVEVERLAIELEAGTPLSHVFKRVPERRNVYHYRAVVEGFEERDAIPENNEALAIVDVRGQPLLLLVEGEEGEGRHLERAMSREGIRLDQRSPEGLPDSLQQLAGYDGIILSDIPAHRLGEGRMTALRDYVEKLGGGLIMIGGMNSFGVGGYYRTPVEEILPVRLNAPDQEEEQSAALALVIDRSGSMAGQPIELCKAAAIATAELLSPRDYIGVYAFDSRAHEVVPMARVTSTSTIANQIAAIGSGGGTNIYPGMVMAREALGGVNAKIKHMIVLTDGHTSGDGYQALASQCYAEGITISTVAVGTGAQVSLLQAIAAAGGGQNYVTMDFATVTRIFTQDAMTYTGRMIREDAFEPRLAETHPMLRDWSDGEAPPLLGYVKTNRKATAQVPLVSDTGDPVLAHWRYGLGKVTAFTSDAKSRWAALWVTDWPGYAPLWAQIIRETARAPQGLNMDLRLEERGGEVRLYVDLLEDAATRRHGATVEAEVFHVPARSLASAMRSHAAFELEQAGPGWYEGRFLPGEPGVYLVRARAGSQIVSAGHVYQPSAEVATGRIDEELLRDVAELTGGTALASADSPLVLEGSEVSRYKELWPLILLAVLALFLADLLLRRWENVLGMLGRGGSRALGSLGGQPRFEG